MQFSASTSLRSGLTLSSAPQSPDITRLVNVSLTSTEPEFERDLQTQLWELTSREKIITDSGSFIIFPLFFHSLAHSTFTFRVKLYTQT